MLEQSIDLLLPFLGHYNLTKADKSKEISSCEKREGGRKPY